MTVVDINPFLLAIFLFCFVFTLGVCCSCVQGSKKTAKYLADQQKNLIKKLEDAQKPGASQADADEAIKEADEFLNKPHSKFITRVLATDAADVIGTDLNDTTASNVWQMFVNETFIGRFFTQEIVAEPIKQIFGIFTTMTAFLGRDLLTAWFATQSSPTQALSDTVTVLFIFIVVFSTLIKTLDSYIREYQGDLVRGVNYANK